jgi:hypothetical protein
VPTATDVRYPLKVERWGEDGENVVSKGHHDPCAFLRRAIRLVAHGYTLDDEPSEWDRAQAREMLATLDHDDVEHEWWRHSPSRDMGAGTEWEGMRFFKIVDGPGRGAFPVTVVRLD